MTPTKQTPDLAATDPGAKAEHTQGHCIDKEPFLQFLEALHGDCEGRANFRALPGRTQIFTNRMSSEACLFAKRHASENVYVGVATRRDDTSGDLTNCLHLPALFIDIDFKTVSEGDARRLLDEFPFPASMRVQSGAGLHAYWLLHEPIDLTDIANRTKAKTILRRLAYHFHGDLAAAEPARILRIPGTLNHKYSPPRPVTLERCDGALLYSLDHLDEFLPPEPEGNRSGAPFMVDEEISEGGRNAHLYKLARSLKTKGLQQSEILATVSTVNTSRCRPPLNGAEVTALVKHAFEQPDRHFEKDSDLVQKLAVEVRQANEWPVLDSAALHGLAGEVVSMLAPHTEADPVALLVTFLSEIGCMLGRGPHLILDGSFHPLLLWFVIIGTSSKSRKGSSDNWIRRFCQLMDPEWTRGQMRGTASSGEGLVFAIRDPVYSPKKKRKRGGSDDQEMECTDPGVPDKRLMLVQSEFSVVLKIMAREGNSLSGTLRDAWDGKTLAPMTKNSVVRATDPHIAIVGHTTNMEFQKYLSEIETSNGFANRYIMALVRRSKLLPHSSAPDPIDLECLARKARGMVQTARTIGRIDLNDSAKVAWEAVYSDLSAERPGLAGSLLARGEAHVLRLAAVYTLLDGQRSIDVTHLTAALALWQYAEASTLQIFGDSTGDADADVILWGVRNTDELTDTQISDLFGRHRSQSRLDQAKGHLQAAGLIYSVWDSTTGGRRRRVWRAGRLPRVTQ